MKLARKIITGFIAMVLGSTVIQAESLSADEVLRRSRDRDDGSSFVSQVSLILHDKRGNTRVREFSYFQKDFDDGDRFAMLFTSPQDVRDVAFLVENPHEELRKEDSQWMYLPVSRQTRRISTTDKRGAFMGSEYSYADLDKLRVNDYRQKLAGEEVVLSRACFVIEREPVSPAVLAKTGYNKTRIWIDKQNYLVMRQEFYDVKGVLIKEARTLDVKTVDGIDSIMHSETENFVDGNRSELKFNQLKYNVDLDERMFTQAALRRALKSGKSASAGTDSL